jgi:hypothetical protein
MVRDARKGALLTMRIIILGPHPEERRLRRVSMDDAK